MRRITPTIFILSLLVSLLFASTIFEEYSATPETNKVTIRWRTGSEADVVKFTILRSMDDQSFNEVNTISAKGQGQDYTFIDENVIFKSSQTFFYKIRAVRSDNSTIEETQSLIVNPNISGIYRTWGAIKAMFR
jgi:hypothetical protein